MIFLFYCLRLKMDLYLQNLIRKLPPAGIHKRLFQALFDETPYNRRLNIDLKDSTAGL